MTSYALIFTLSAIGISETVYLIRKRISLQRPICPIGESCDTVLTSKYSKMFVVPLDVLGLVFYFAISFMSGLLVIGVESPEYWDLVFRVMIAVGVMASMFFTFLQWKIIKAWCFWCLMSACTVFLIGGIILLRDFMS